MQYFILSCEFVFLACAMFGFCYGAKYYFKPKKALFPQIVVCGLGCLALGQLFSLVKLIFGQQYNSFDVGMLAPIGFYFFLLSANYGQMDSLLENKLRENRKYSYIAFAAPAVILLALIPLWLSQSDISIKIVYTVLFVMCAAAAYFNLKHAIFVDVPDGIIDTIRWYNRIALMIESVNVAVVICYVCNFQLARGILLIVEAGLCAGLMPVFKKEAKKWYR